MRPRWRLPMPTAVSRSQRPTEDQDTDPAPRIAFGSRRARVALARGRSEVKAASLSFRHPPAGQGSQLADHATQASAHMACSARAGQRRTDYRQNADISGAQISPAGDACGTLLHANERVMP
jgi:hypothetical protein